MKDDKAVYDATSSLAATAPKVGGVWTHLKSGGTYEIVAHVVIEATITPAVAYRSREKGVTWVRPLAEFLDGRFAPVEAGG